MARDPSVFVHTLALCESDEVGPRTRIWAFAHVLEGARVGADCNICDGVFVEGGAIVGDRVTVKCGVQLWTGVELEDDVFVGPNATFTNDSVPPHAVVMGNPARIHGYVESAGGEAGESAGEVAESAGGETGQISTSRTE